MVGIVYVRHPFDWLVSASQRLVKVGKRTEAQLDLLRGRPRFAKWLGRLKGHFAEDCLVVRPFARDQLIDGDVTVDLL